MEGEELGMALNNVEQANEAQLNQMAEQEFFDRYPRFNNDRALGLTILENLNAKGYDTSAADSAVQDVINELRDQFNNAMNLLGESNQQLQRQMEENNIAAEVAMHELNKKLDTVDEAVKEAAQQTGDQAIADSITASEMEPAAPQDLSAGNAEAMPEMPAEQPPVDMGTGAEVPPETAPVDQPPAEPAPEVAPAPVESAPVPPEQQPLPPEQQLGPNQIPSDERLKNIKSKFKQKFAERQKARNSTRLNSNIIEACGR